MAEYEKKVRAILDKNGYHFKHHGQGSHDIWFNESNNHSVAVGKKIKSRHMANTIMKEAGINHHF